METIKYTYNGVYDEIRDEILQMLGTPRQGINEIKVLKSAKPEWPDDISIILDNNKWIWIGIDLNEINIWLYQAINRIDTFGSSYKSQSVISEKLVMLMDPNCFEQIRQHLNVLVPPIGDQDEIEKRN